MRKCNPLFVLIAVVLCMTAFLLPAYAQASDGEAAVAQEPAGTEEKASVPETPLTPKGNLTLVDDVEQKGDAKGKEQSKQFLTVESKSGNTFYLVIDYDKPIDEDAEMYETHFLNLVDERDLLALMSDEEKEEVPTPTPEIIYVTPEPTAVPQPTTVPVETEKQEGPDQMTAILALAAIVLLAGVGAFLFFRNKGKGNTRSADTDFDLDDDDAEDSGESAE